jgi:ABC-type Fe3+-siderophore transport system permease subunit
MVASPVGYRCPDCSRTQRSVVYDPSTTGLIKAAGVGLILAAAIGFFWGSYPSWGFYMALLMGFGVAEGIAWAANYKRGRELQVLSMGMVLFGVAVSRVTIALFTPGLDVEMLLTDSGNPVVRNLFYLRVVPDVVFMGVAFLICFVRFK